MKYTSLESPFSPHRKIKNVYRCYLFSLLLTKYMQNTFVGNHNVGYVKCKEQEVDKEFYISLIFILFTNPNVSNFGNSTFFFISSTDDRNEKYYFTSLRIIIYK